MADLDEAGMIGLSTELESSLLSLQRLKTFFLFLNNFVKFIFIRDDPLQVGLDPS